MDANDLYQPPGAVGAVAAALDPAPLFSIAGRLGRVRYMAYGVLAVLIVLVPGALLGGVLEAAGIHFASIAVVAAIYLATFVFSMILAVRRCHDFNASGWLALISLVPLLNLALLFIPGTDGANRFGNRTVPNSTTLIVVALVVPLLFVLGILAAVALPAYNEYIDNANMAKVNSHYEEGARFVANEMRKRRTETALGRSSALPATTQAWIELLNPNGVLAPNGEPAFQPAADVQDGSGVIGVEVQGTAGDGTLVVNLRRAAYEDLPADHHEIRYSEL